MHRPSLVHGLFVTVLLLGLCSAGAAQTTEPPQSDPRAAVQPAEQEQPQEQPAAAEPAPVAVEQTVPAGIRQENIDTSGKFKLSLSGLYGIGFDAVEVGVTNYGDKVSISGGGGLGFTGQIGYGMSSRIDLDIDLGVQVSVLEPAVENADGTFARSYLLATLKYKVPTSDTGQFKFGIGAGSYFGGELDVDTASVPGGNHTIVTYGPAVGMHVTGEFERFVRPDLSFHLGAKISLVTYDADEVTVNGVKTPVAFLKDDIREFDGSGLDVMIGLTKYF